MAGSEPLILVTGGRNQGKSTKVKALIAKLPRVIVLDVMREYHKEPGFKIAKTMPELQKLQRSGKYKIAFQPSLDKVGWPVWNHRLCKYLINFQDRYKVAGKVPPPICLVVEEMSRSAPNEKQTLDNRGFDEMIDQGRHAEISVIGVTQRVAKAKKDFVEQAEECFILRIGARDAALMESLHLPPEMKGAIGKLSQHEFIHVAGLDIKTGKNQLKKPL